MLIQMFFITAIHHHHRFLFLKGGGDDFSFGVYLAGTTLSTALFFNRGSFGGGHDSL